MSSASELSNYQDPISMDRVLELLETSKRDQKKLLCTNSNPHKELTDKTMTASNAQAYAMALGQCASRAKKNTKSEESYMCWLQSHIM